MELMTLKEMCESVGVSRRSIQCYEAAGLVKPTKRNKYGYLLYDQETLHRAELIKFMQELGFKLKDIKKIIDAPKYVMKEALERRVKELEEEGARLNQIIQEAITFMETLED